jgi:uncharacterized protein (DUF4213/DUF364 family)
VTDNFHSRFFTAADSAVVIGFGGYLDYLIRMTDTRRIHVSDLWFHRRTKIILQRLESYAKEYPEKEITFSDGSDNRERLACADLALITGSAFCNGTMDALLEDARNCKTVIVDGESATVLPEILFKKGVSLVCTSMKPTNLIEIARSNPQQFKQLLEGDLPKIYVEPLY